jgi:hypothetical protein
MKSRYWRSGTPRRGMVAKRFTRPDTQNTSSRAERAASFYERPACRAVT